MRYVCIQFKIKYSVCIYLKSFSPAKQRKKKDNKTEKGRIIYIRTNKRLHLEYKISRHPTSALYICFSIHKTQNTTNYALNFLAIIMSINIDIYADC